MKYSRAHGPQVLRPMCHPSIMPSWPLTGLYLAGPGPWIDVPTQPSPVSIPLPLGSFMSVISVVSSRRRGIKHVTHLLVPRGRQLELLGVRRNVCTEYVHARVFSDLILLEFIDISELHEYLKVYISLS